ncbi:S8 family serine peptidase [Pseudolysobacter antarcticus]|uniref:S8 family serine peptidase n=1 Tax=Pseudolysobacter antarcticus TaxID=2511995 RepID=UPI0013EC14B3|nr:S8 family serine peptidase [Pseudolysobacter antarcticus]
MYIIRFSEPGALDYKGGNLALKATAPVSESREQFDVKRPEVTAYRKHLIDVQASHLHDIAGSIGREIHPKHSYDLVFNGIAVELSASEAAKVATLAGVEAITADEILPLDTFRGPAFIGAPAIWNAPPGDAIHRGAGVTIGILDSGTNTGHPSFTDDASCGFGPSNHKLKAAGCATSSGGVCTSSDVEADAYNSAHGVHTASIAGGNTVDNSATPSPNLPAPWTQISGVAPCAKINSYKVCNTVSPTLPGCGTSDSIAGVNNAIADGVNAINFSIGGGTTPWNATDVDRAFLNAVNAGIFVAASAGNTTATITSPIGQVNHKGPWVNTVAASSQDKQLGVALSATGPGTPPANTQILLGTPGSTTPAATAFTNLPIGYNAANPTGCTATGGFPANFFAGSVALIARGACNFTEKMDNATAAGAQAIFIYNNAIGIINMDTAAAGAAAQLIQTYSLLQVDGQNLVSFITANGATPTTTSFDPNAIGTIQGDVLADFSFRGPMTGNYADLTKPDDTGPGVVIYAAWNPIDGGTSYKLESGTSMSGPHLAGSGALLKAVHPDWTPAEIKSAIQMTAVTGTKEDGVTQWAVDDVGSGRVDLSKATAAGFVMNETYANFLAANPSGGTINVKTLNLASVRNAAVVASYTWTRTLRNTLPVQTTWNVTVQTPTGLNVTVVPNTFSFNGTADTVFTDNFELPAKQVLTITAAPTATFTAMTFAQVIFTEVNNKAPPMHITVAIKGHP